MQQRMIHRARMLMRRASGLNDYDAAGKFYDPSARASASAPAAASPAAAAVAAIPVPAAVTTATPVATAVAVPPTLPSGTPTDLISLRIAVLEAIRAFQTSQTKENLLAIVNAKNSFRTALMALRGSAGGGGWGGGWGGGRGMGRRRRRRFGKAWPASIGYGSNYGYAGGAWGSTPPGGVVPAVTPVQPTVAASSDPSARALSGFGCARGSGMNDYLQMGEFSRGAGMMYADDPLSGSVNDADFDTMDGIFDNLFGGDPIEKHYPGMSLPEVWKKQSDYVDKYNREVYGLHSATAVKEFAGKIQSIYRLKSEIAPAFTPGAIIGSRERTKLGELVQKVYDFRSDWHKAKKKYGWSPPAGVVEETESAPMLPGVPSPEYIPESSGGLPTWLLFVPVGLIAMWMFGGKKK
jgi:hypothetical protein